jgi:D-alanine--poly(phosphoribitol) ligase subunit 1
MVTVELESALLFLKINMKHNVLQYLNEAVSLTPDKLAYVDEAESFTFKQIQELSYKVADVVFEPGIKNSPVAVIMPKRALSLVAFLGAAYSGNFYVPIDMKYPKERLLTVLRDLGTNIILTDNVTFNLVSGLGVDESAKIINLEEVLKNKPSSFDYNEVINKKIDTDPIYCIYTSGSTGTPKGVLIPHRAVIDYLEYAIPTFNISENVIIGNQAQFHFDLSVLDVFAPLKARATTVVVPEAYFSFTSKLVDFLREKKVNFLCWAPAVLSYLSSVKILDNQTNLNIKYVLFCGEALPVRTLNYWKHHLGDAVFVNLYGPTETTLSSTHYFIEREFIAEEVLPIGYADRNTDVFLIDEVDGVGEICIRGSSLALGYWNDFKRTEEKFIQNPMNKHYPEKIYLTGDLGKINEKNEILYVGRKDNQIKHMGYRIELEEIERALDKVVGITGSYAFYDNSKKEIVCAYSVSDVSPSVATIKKSLKEYLPGYMIPAIFSEYKELPLNSRGKLDRALIKENYYGKN